MERISDAVLKILAEAAQWLEDSIPEGQWDAYELPPRTEVRAALVNPGIRRLLEPLPNSPDVTTDMPHPD